MTSQPEEFVRMRPPPRNVLCRWLNICSYFISLLMMAEIGPRGGRKSWQPLLKRASLSAPRPAASPPRAPGFAPHLPGHQLRSDVQPCAGWGGSYAAANPSQKNGFMHPHTRPFPWDTRDRNIHAMCNELRGVEEGGGNLQGGAR